MKRGQITVFLALLLSVICGFLLAVIESTRVSAMRMQIESGLDLGLHSIFAEYDRALLSRYDLFYIDTSYRGESTDISGIETHLYNYMETNISQDQKSGKSSGDWFRMSVKNLELPKYLLASDHEGRVLRRQVVRYMKQKNIVDQAETGNSLVNQIQSYGLEERDIDGERTSAENRIKEIPIPEVINMVNGLRGGSTAELTTGGMKISEGRFQEQQLYSHRTHKVGKDVAVFQERIAGEEADQLFDAYLMLKCSDYTESKGQGVMTYELEYLIAGQNSDLENLDDITRKLLKMREAANVTYLFGSEEKRAEAEEYALLLTAGVEIPGLTEAVTISLLYAWGYAEAVLDVNCLLCGGKVPIMKSDADWRLPLKELLVFRSHFGESGGSGFTYRQYLSAYLAKEDAVIKRSRCMDVIEENVRLMEGNKRFCMDGCIEYVQAYVEASSRYGYEYNILRDYGYEVNE